jgi:hypothetical protein
MKISSLRITQHFTDEIDQVLDFVIGVRLLSFDDDCRTNHVACGPHFTLPTPGKL